MIAWARTVVSPMCTRRPCWPQYDDWQTLKNAKGNWSKVAIVALVNDTEKRHNFTTECMRLALFCIIRDRLEQPACTLCDQSSKRVQPKTLYFLHVLYCEEQCKSVQTDTHGPMWPRTNDSNLKLTLTLINSSLTRLTTIGPWTQLVRQWTHGTWAHQVD